MYYRATLFGGLCGEVDFKCDSVEEALEKAKEWAVEGDWDSDLETFWVELDLIAYDENYNIVQVITEQIPLHPEDPFCMEDEAGVHEWTDDHSIVGGIEENPGVWGNGGGVFIQRACKKCGMLFEENTWATNPNTGEQGLYARKYVPRYYTGIEQEINFP